MRRIATVPSNPEVARLILYATDHGVYVFPCASERDGSGMGDEWYENVEAAESSCWERYGVETSTWTQIDDPLPGCQHDWIEPVRIIGRDEGSPQWGRLERLEAGTWVEIERFDGEWYPKQDRHSE